MPNYVLYAEFSDNRHVKVEEAKTEIILSSDEKVMARIPLSGDQDDDEDSRAFARYMFMMVLANITMTGVVHTICDVISERFGGEIQ